MSELYHFAVELFPTHKITTRASKFESISAGLVEDLLFEQERAYDPLFGINKTPSEPRWKDTTLDLFGRSSGRQLSGNHRLTAILLVDKVFEPTSALAMNTRAAMIIKKVNLNLARAKQSRGRLAVSVSEEERLVWNGVAQTLKSAFRNRGAVLEAHMGYGYVTARHVLFATRSEIALSNICVPPEQLEAFEAGVPVFISALRLFKGEPLPRGRQKLSAIETEARSAFGVATYRLRHLLAGFHSAGGRIDWLHPELGDGQADADLVLIALTGEHMMESIRSVFANLNEVQLRQKLNGEAGRTGPDALADLIRLGGATLRENTGVVKDRNALAEGRSFKLIGQRAGRRQKNAGRSIIQLFREDLKVGAFLNARASILNSEVDVFNNVQGRLQKPIATESRTIFAQEASALVKELTSSPNGESMDRWTWLAFNLAINPVRFWPAAWPFYLHFEGAIANGAVFRGQSLDQLQNDKVIGLDVVLNFDAPASTALAHSRRLLRILFPRDELDDFNRANSCLSNPLKMLQLDEKTQLDLAEFRKQQLKNKNNQ